MSTEHGFILVVDDNEMNRDMLSRRLQRRGYSVTCAEDGFQALEKIGKQPFDLVLLDIMMPGINGIEVLKKVRESYTATDLAIIMVTAKDQSDDIVDALKLGANDYVTKPLDFPVVLARVQTQLSLKQSVDEIRRLEQNLAQRNEELKAINQELETVNQKMKRDLDAAAAVQQSLLPTILPNVDGVNFAWHFQPCDELAGDFLNLFHLDEKHLGLYVVDVSGHGVAASLLSASVSRVLTPEPSISSLLVKSNDGASGNRVVQPDEVAMELNRRFPMEQSAQRYFTIVYGVLNIETYQFRYVSAGQPPLVHTSAGIKSKLLKADGYAIGWFDDADYEEKVLQLMPGDRLYLYSDGITEAMNAQSEAFGNDRLLRVIEQWRSRTLQESVANLVRETESWCLPDGLQDDVSVLAVEIEPQTS